MVATTGCPACLVGPGKWCITVAPSKTFDSRRPSLHQRRIQAWGRRRKDERDAAREAERMSVLVRLP